MASTSQNPESAFTFLPQGALIQEFSVAGHNVVLSLPTASAYATHNQGYFGETIGRTTNRIRGGQIPDLNSKTYQLATNDSPRPNLLHGGKEGWGKKTWDGPEPVNRYGKEGVQFTYVSKDGDEGYPGTVKATVWYVAAMETREGRKETVLDVEYEAEFIGDECEETVVGMTNHSYFTVNPSAPTISGTTLTLATSHHLELDAEQIPTGRVIRHPSVPETPHAPFTLFTRDPVFDDCFVLPPRDGSPEDFDRVADEVPLDTRELGLREMVRMAHDDTGLNLIVESTEPAFQLYTGEGIAVPELERGDGTLTERMGSRKGIAIEPSRFVDAPGRREWRGMCTVKRREVWGARNRYRAWKE